MAAPINQDEKNYLEEKVNSYLEPMLIEILEELPGDSLGFMKKWQNVRGEGIKDEMINQELEYQQYQLGKKGDGYQPPLPALIEARNHHEESASPRKPYGGDLNETPVSKFNI